MNGKKDSRLQTFSKEYIKSIWVFDKKYSAKTAFNFLDKLQQRVELIIQYSKIGKPSQKKEHVRSVTLQPHNKNLLQAQQK